MSNNLVVVAVVVQVCFMSGAVARAYLSPPVLIYSMNEEVNRTFTGSIVDWAGSKLMASSGYSILLSGAIADANDECEQWLSYMDNSRADLFSLVAETDRCVARPGNHSRFMSVWSLDVLSLSHGGH